MMNSKDLISELEFELISTSKLLELVPADKLDWQPHAKSMTLGVLAYHVAAIPGRYLSFAEAGSTMLQTLIDHEVPKNKGQILSHFKASTVKAHELLKEAENWDAKLWSLTKNGNVVFTLPVPLFIRLLVFNHLCHHRGQLTAYLRTLNVPLPSIYGPSADEDPFA